MDELGIILKNDYEDAKKNTKKLNELNAEAIEYVLNDCDKIRNEMIEYEKIKLENDVKNKEIESKNKQDKSENLRTYLKIGVVTLLSIGSAVLTHRHFKETLDFDRDSTSTSTNGRKVISSASTFDSSKLFGWIK